MRTANILLCIFLSAAAAFSQANEPLLRALLDLPSPPPFEKTPDIEKTIPQQRPESFYHRDNVPPDDAPIEDLLDYWKRNSSSYYSSSARPKASQAVALRILENIKDDPKAVSSYLGVLPERDQELCDVVDQILLNSLSSENSTENITNNIRRWLRYNSPNYLQELVNEARQARDHKSYGSVIKEDELIALAKLDWKEAASIIESLSNDGSNPRTAILAKVLRFERAIEDKETGQIDRLREELKEIVTDKSMPAYGRDAAADALFSTDWQGRDEWYLSLFQDESLKHLSDGNTLYSPLTTLPTKDPEKWVPILTKLLDNPNKVVRSAAVQSLMEIKTKESITPLLRWLYDPEWAEITWSPGGRSTLMQIVTRFDLRESIPGLIWIVKNEPDEIMWAARSLGTFKDSSAVPALRNALLSVDYSDRNIVIDALIACGGITADEQLSALQKYAEIALIPEERERLNNTWRDDPNNPVPVNISIGKRISEMREPSEELVKALIERQAEIRDSQPDVARFLSEIRSRWSGRAIDIDMLGQIEAGTADIETLVGVLARRGELRESVPNELMMMRGQSGFAGAFAACVSEDENDLLSAYRSDDIEQRAAVMACARLLRLPLPIEDAGEMMSSSNKLLALAAERYLESEDSPEARRMIYARYLGEAKILGARDSFNPTRTTYRPAMLSAIFASVDRKYGSSLRPGANAHAELDKFEDEIRKELLGNNDLLEIYALDNNRIVRIYKDRATYTLLEDKARYREWDLDKEQVDLLKSKIYESGIEDLPPIFGGCHHDCGSFQLLRINRNGGRRSYAYTGFGRSIGFYALFQSLGQKNNGKLRYYVQEKIPNLEVLFEGGTLQPVSVWKSGADFRILVADTEHEDAVWEELRRLGEEDDKNEDLGYEQKQTVRFERRAARETEHYSWREFKDGRPGDRAGEPNEIPFIAEWLSFPSAEDTRNNHSKFMSRWGSYEIRMGDSFDRGLWRVNRFEKTEIAKGWFGQNPIVSGDWVVAAKTDTNWADPNYLVRINLLNGREFKIDIPPANELEAAAVIPETGKVLVYRSENPYSTLTPTSAEYYLLDPASGRLERVHGEFHPLMTNPTRPFQSTGRLNEYWATIYSRAKNSTALGKYNTRNFSFAPVMELPGILINTMETWIDQEEMMLYFIYSADHGQGSHLLRLPIETSVDQEKP